MKQYRAIHIPVILKGPGNYITWSRMARTALGGRGLWEDVSSSSAPKQITQGEDGKEVVVVDEGKWVQEDLMVLSTLQSSLDGPLMDSYSHSTTTKQFPSFNNVVKHILRDKELPCYDEVCAQLQKEIGSDGLFGGGKGGLSMTHN
uniref:Retrotransposon Copia-like N-terminal domain-containing protein n=1 Tax=Brassica oleracea var. oleracea TaxID=109376 RepID=A0A0D3CC14_BRAOL